MVRTSTENDWRGESSGSALTARTIRPRNEKGGSLFASQPVEQESVGHAAYANALPSFRFGPLARMGSRVQTSRRPLLMLSLLIIDCWYQAMLVDVESHRRVTVSAIRGMREARIAPHLVRRRTRLCLWLRETRGTTRNVV